ncbi:MAG: hypothetical protein K2L00_02965 [Muribaculaceae bacterium]|nr:hypothetical protein [Muribaculaceae bacterium]
MNTKTASSTRPYSGIIRPDRGKTSEYRGILAMARAGELIKLRNGLYADIDTLTSSMVDISVVVPGGILCLYSAWYHYGLSTQAPDAFYVAVARSRKLTLPSFPDIRLVYQNEKLLHIGRKHAMVDGLDVLITDLERSVCDAVKYRNKIGIDVMVEIIDNYLRKPERNISLLTDYAKKLRVYNTLNQILQVKL